VTHLFVEVHIFFLQRNELRSLSSQRSTKSGLFTGTVNCSVAVHSIVFSRLNTRSTRDVWLVAHLAKIQDAIFVLVVFDKEVELFLDLKTKTRCES